MLCCYCVQQPTAVLSMCMLAFLIVLLALFYVAYIKPELLPGSLQVPGIPAEVPVLQRKNLLLVLLASLLGI